MCAHTRFRIHLNPLPLHIFPLSPPASLCRIQKLNQIHRSDFLLPFLRGWLSMGFTPVSIHTQFRSSFSFTMVTSRHLSTFSLQTPPSTKMPLLLWLCFAQFPMPINANTTVNNVLFVAAFKSIRSIPYLLNDCSFSLPLGCARSDTTFHTAILLQARLTC